MLALLLARKRHGSTIGFFPRLLGLCDLPVAFFSYRRRTRIRRVCAWSSRTNRHRPQPSRSRGGLSSARGPLLGGRAVLYSAGLVLTAYRPVSVTRFALL